MIILGIDTTGPWCSVGLLNGGADKTFTQETRVERSGPGHAELLAPMVQNILHGHNTKPSDIDRIIVCTGPGSFTGVRVGLSFAKGFALPHGIDILGVSALEIWAYAADPGAHKDIFSAADVRRGQVFWQIFSSGKAVGTPVLSSLEDAQNFCGNMPCAGQAAHLLTGIESTKPDTCHVDPKALMNWGRDKHAKDYPPTPL
ncbi:MAG TPA: tRNA (adenosine(37)-N6)-threonylcarbamoyltransferase complex dimerization subunit type 1 TsaB, partial [Hellea balneolensis]|nr:tRNA (adenosine(37)-N6)-threonylcarbamoyltransferase complex dimerization subunit type 1 TsaB [Hellea balneolensis]